MKKSLVVLFISAMAVFTACGGNGGNASETVSSSVNDISDETSGDDVYTDEECYISITDGEESYNIPVASYGDEIELPEPKGASSGGEFVGWLNYKGLFASGDKVVSEEFDSYEAIYTSPAESLFIMLDNKVGGYSTSMSEAEEFEVENPYAYSDNFNNNDYYIDYYTDEDGNRYDFGETVKIGKGECLILTTVYSEDLSGAFRVSLSYNSPIDEGFYAEENYRYVKKGEVITVESMIEYDGFTMEGWYDAQEGGNFICADGESFAPSSDIDLFAHWKAN